MNWAARGANDSMKSSSVVKTSESCVYFEFPECICSFDAVALKESIGTEKNVRKMHFCLNRVDKVCTE